MISTSSCFVNELRTLRQSIVSFQDRSVLLSPRGVSSTRFRSLKASIPFSSELVLDPWASDETVLALNLLDLLEVLNLKHNFAEAAYHPDDHDSASESM